MYHTPDLVFLERDGVTLVVDAEGPNWLSTNGVGGEILRLANGRRTVSGLTQELRARSSATPPTGEAEVVQFLEEVASRELASLRPFARPPYRGRGDAIAPGRLAELYVFVTNDCNLRCSHCYVSSGDYVPPDEMTTSDLIRLVDDARELGVTRFYFTGGEPFMRKDIFDLIDHVCAASELVILTNATYFNGTVLAKLGEVARRANGAHGEREGAPRRLHFQVSLDGPDAELHEAIRGAKTFERTVEGIRALVALDLTPAVSTSITVNNADRIADTTRLLASLGVREHHLLWLQERGRAYDNDDLLLAPAKVTEIMREVSAVASPLGMVIDNETSHRVRIRGKRNRKTDLCNCGYESLDVFSDGQVYPCVWFSGAPSLACGSVREQSLRDIWLRSPILESIRQNSVQKRDGCSDCHLKFLCGGGTNCSSYFDSLATQGRGSFQAAEPYCETFMDLTYDLLWEEAMPKDEVHAVVGSSTPRVLRSMEGEGAECARPHTTSLDQGVEVGSFHCACVLQADVLEGNKVRARVRAVAEQAGDVAPRPPPRPDADLFSVTARTPAPAPAAKRRLPLSEAGSTPSVVEPAAAAPRLASGEPTAPPFDAHFDAIGETCIELLLPMAKMVKALPPGQILKVVTDDIAAREDLAAWCRMTGHELVYTQKNQGYASYFIRRGA